MKNMYYMKKCNKLKKNLLKVYCIFKYPMLYLKTVFFERRV